MISFRRPNTRTIAIFTMILPCFAIALAHAGSESEGLVGNGGFGCVKRHPQGMVLQARLLDLVEAEQKWGLHFDNSPSGAAARTSIESAVQRLEFFSGYNRKLAPDWKRLGLTQKPIWNLDLRPTVKHSVDRPETLPKDCTLEQIANWLPDGKLEISAEAFGQMPQIDQAGLILHESLYRWARVALGHKNSDQVRRLVGILLSKEGLQQQDQTFVQAFMGVENANQSLAHTDQTPKK